MTYCKGRATSSCLTAGCASNDVAGLWGGILNLNLKRVSQSPIWNTHASKSPPKRPPHATANSFQQHRPADIPAFPGCALIGPSSRHGPHGGTRPQPEAVSIKADTHGRTVWTVTARTTARRLIVVRSCCMTTQLSTFSILYFHAVWYAKLS